MCSVRVVICAGVAGVRSDERAPWCSCPCCPDWTDRCWVLPWWGGPGRAAFHWQHLQIHTGWFRGIYQDVLLSDRVIVTEWDDTKVYGLWQNGMSSLPCTEVIIWCHTFRDFVLQMPEMGLGGGGGSFLRYNIYVPWGVVWDWNEVISILKNLWAFPWQD